MIREFQNKHFMQAYVLSSYTICNVRYWYKSDAPHTGTVDCQIHYNFQQWMSWIPQR